MVRGGMARRRRRIGGRMARSARVTDGAITGNSTSNTPPTPEHGREASVEENPAVTTPSDPIHLDAPAAGRRRRYTPSASGSYSTKPHVPGDSISIVARRDGVAPSVLFHSKRVMDDASNERLKAGEAVSRHASRPRRAYVKAADVDLPSCDGRDQAPRCSSGSRLLRSQAETGVLDLRSRSSPPPPPGRPAQTESRSCSA